MFLVFYFYWNVELKFLFYFLVSFELFEYVGEHEKIYKI